MGDTETGGIGAQWNVQTAFVVHYR
jgi:hypothetical protein